MLTRHFEFKTRRFEGTLATMNAMKHVLSLVETLKGGATDFRTAFEH
jgi:hypothetical protein